MSKPRTQSRPCIVCQGVSDNGWAPIHVVHPVDREPGLFDIYGRAKCPECSAVWHRGQSNHARLVG